MFTVDVNGKVSRLERMSFCIRGLGTLSDKRQSSAPTPKAETQKWSGQANYNTCADSIAVSQQIARTPRVCSLIDAGYDYRVFLCYANSFGPRGSEHLPLPHLNRQEHHHYGS